MHRALPIPMTKVGFGLSNYVYQVSQNDASTQGWRQKSSDGGAGASDRGLKWLKRALFVRHFVGFSPTGTKFPP